MRLRLSTLLDISSIMEIVMDAQIYLANQGIDQWQDGYPDVAQIERDIASQESYVIENEEGEVMATTMFTTRPESTYASIDGAWVTTDLAKYGVIHRMAVSAKHRKKGLAKFIIHQCEVKLKEMEQDSLRIDTHQQNLGMQHLLKGLGYQQCGIIILESGDDRLAFEKLME